MSKPEYLGDGVYASFDGYHIWLTTGSHEERDASNRIALEPSVFDALIRYQAALRAELGQASAELRAQGAELDTQRDMVRDTLADLNRKIDLLAAANAEIARLKEDRDFWRESSNAEGKAKLRAEGKLRGQERATQQLSAEQKLAAAEREAERWQVCAEGLKSDLDHAEQKLASAEREREGNANAWTVQWDRANAAEARCRELESTNAALRNELSRDMQASGESELAQLRERVLPPFREAWERKRREGYQYGNEALEQVRFGYEIAGAELARREANPDQAERPEPMVDVIRDAVSGELESAGLESRR